MHKNLMYALIAIVALGAIMTIAQIWLMFMSWDIYIKLIITLGILGVLIGFLLVVKIDFAEHKRLKGDNYLD
ncbi:MAG: hypothetical protein KTR28_01745 [Micavibrio sp.]|nr:hypothetical protein [Micavibrio sp.]